MAGWKDGALMLERLEELIGSSNRMECAKLTIVWSAPSYRVLLLTARGC